MRYHNNFLEIKPQINFIWLLILLIFLQIMILYLQAIYGGNVFCPTEINAYNYYKSKEEILLLEKDFEKVRFCIYNFV